MRRSVASWDRRIYAAEGVREEICRAPEHVMPQKQGLPVAKKFHLIMESVLRSSEELATMDFMTKLKCPSPQVRQRRAEDCASCLLGVLALLLLFGDGPASGAESKTKATRAPPDKKDVCET